MSKATPKTSAKRSCLGIIIKAVATFVIGFIAWCIWDVTISPRVSTLGKHTRHPAFLYTCVNSNRSVSVIGFSPDGSRFLTAGRNQILIHDAATGDKISEVKDQWRRGKFEVSGERSVITAIWTNKKTTETQLNIFDWNGKLLRTIDMEPGSKSGSIAMIAKLNGGFASSEDGRVVLRHANGEHIIELPGEVGGYKLISSADGNVIVAEHIDSLHIWRLDAPDAVRTISAPSVSDAQLSEDGSRLAANADDEVRVWSTIDGSLLTTWKSKGLDLFSSALSRDGTRIAAGAKDGTIVVADADSGAELHRFENEMTPSSMAFSPNADRIIAGLMYESTVSGGELISSGTSGAGGSGRIRQSENRISRTPGYAIAWSLKNKSTASP